MSLYVQESGDRSKPSIVFLHGGGMSGWMWERTVDYFGDYHCIVPDLPRHGRSQSQSPLRLSDCAEQITEIIHRKANHGRAHLVGHSLGGKIIVEMLGSYPDIIDRAVVASALFDPVKLLRLMHRPSTYQLTVALLRNQPLLKWMVGRMGLEGAREREALKEDFARLTAKSLYDIYEQLYLYDSIPSTLEKCDRPTLIVFGTKEFRAMRTSAIRLAGALGNARITAIEGADHRYPWTNFSQFNELVRNWISSSS